ncbi:MULTISPECIES: hypothetical protein [Tenacibaculum]|uniref:hypothetical protein n=1 Tax=Tenacibaculum TaxID=104267 RepID=UPI001F0B0EED|nr:MULTISPECIES: hypothetical protein [Tenacibaculum]MCH3882418.1 hypothetical protein [Tenacibaculum aquimarinum]MDO6600099.1 hypothetical protein [Tenacibaculum sp. 1_MG-2023]
MKALKGFVLIAVFFLMSCSSDEEKIDTTPMVQEVTATLDLDALNNLAGTDATGLIRFNGIPASEYTTEAIVGDEIIYEVTTTSSNTIVRFVEFHFSSGNEELWANGLESVLDTTGWLVGLEVLEGVNEDDELKFDIDFQLEVDGQLQSEVYTIDPKIKIKSRR